jgi:DHA1 family inner membrane transport protein
MFGPARLFYALRPHAPVALFLGAIAVGLMFAATPFLIPEVADRYDVSAGMAGGLSVIQVGLFAITTFVLPRFLAPSRRIFVVAGIGVVVANVASMLPGYFWSFLIARGVAGAAAGTITWIAWTDAMQEPRSMAGIAAAGPVAALAGAPLFGAIASYGDRAIYGVLAAIAIPMLFVRLDVAGTAGLRGKVSRSRSNRILLLTLSILTFSGSSLFVYAAYGARELLDLSPIAASIGYSLNAAAGIVGARFSARHRRPGWWLATTGPAAFLSLGCGSPWCFFFGMTWWGFAFWMGIPGVLHMLAARSLAPGERAGDAQGVMAVGRAFGPVLGGGLVDAGAFTALAVAAGTGLTVAGATVIGVQEGRDRLPPTDPRVAG